MFIVKLYLKTFGVMLIRIFHIVTGFTFIKLYLLLHYM